MGVGLSEHVGAYLALKRLRSDDSADLETWKMGFVPFLRRSLTVPRYSRGGCEFDPMSAPI